MKALGISLPAFRIAGELLLFYTAFQMVFAERGTGQEGTRNRRRDHRSYRQSRRLPAGDPAHERAGLDHRGHPSRWPRQRQIGQAQAGLVLVILLVILLCYLTFLLSERVARLFGTTGTLVLGRMLGVVLRGTRCAIRH